MTSDRTSLLPSTLLIGDQRIGTASGGVLEHIHPASGKVQASLPLAGAAEIDQAVAAAQAALPIWRSWDPSERRRALIRLADLFRKHAEEISTIHSLETGMPFTQADWPTKWGIDWLEDAAGWADKLYGDTVPISSQGLFNYTSIEPFGVVATILTWNGSVGAFGMAAGPALAAGCTVVVKPSELSPFGPIRAAELALEAGFPPGVVNVVAGGPEAGEALVSHPGISKIAFTGGGPTAKRIAVSAAQNLTPSIFELGGKSASITFGDADLSAAVAHATFVSVHAGQQCTLGSRMFVHTSVFEEFNDRLASALEAMKVGLPFDEGSQMGPLINQAAMDRVHGLVDRARAYGEVRAGGTRLGGQLSDGYFFPPTLVSGVTNDSELARTEVFGPVLATIPFEDEDEAIAMANDSEFGLSGYIFSSDISRVHRVVPKLDTGNVGVNGAFVTAGPTLPFGGRKQSGYGKQGGLAGVMEFINTKTVTVKLGDPS
ncbi:aldehyde dehydrogenase [Williamsia sp. D3]|uniref:aldehyde dehydrogenase family protein n=1 Tax=Williamsia sp. D3 TaxID=1313067 RepID=UPI0004CFDC0E|nr:aldehyde dehydrogenase family protein [Williamsia sp. D3]